MRDNRTGQFGWVVLLLAMAVILPTVCLLWFMMQAVRNERLAVRQKLVDIYSKRCQEVVNSVPSESLDKLEAAMAGGESFIAPGLGSGGVCSSNGIDGYILYDPNGRALYPVMEGGRTVMPMSPGFEAAERLEFADSNCVRALEAYGRLAGSTSDKVELSRAIVASARCMRKLGRTQEAMAELGKAAYPRVQYMDSPEVISEVLRARVILMQMQSDAGGEMFSSRLRMLLSAPEGDHYSSFPQRVGAYTDVRLWALGELARMADKAGLGQSAEMGRAKATIAADELAMRAAGVYPDSNSLGEIPASTARRLRTEDALYGVHFRTRSGEMLCIMKPQTVRDRMMSSLAKGIEDDTVTCRVVDERGTVVDGTAQGGEPFVRVGMGKWMPDWKLELYLRDASAFERAASRQAAIYAWVAMLVISLIGAVAVVAGFSINRQMKINRLKNDFVATVTHELKTPISSMRVLVDTLLEGNCQDRKQEREYLELIAHENLRLSRLIDNFLTFSRMERNKKAFDIRPCQADSIVADAVEAVKTKFGSRKCGFTTEVSSGLPEVLADHDSIVTVLVNLLDNACKYSGDDKRIALKAFAENGDACFAVTDNGYGMTKRVMKRIFDRFYQADQSLARSAEGCGLGLSIVKFIVDAHKGRIEVQSKPGEGSCFTVRLPAAGN